MQTGLSIAMDQRGSSQCPSRAALTATLAAFSLLAASAAELSPAEERIPVLRVGSQVYSNVTVTSVTATDIYFTHSRGIGNAKLKRLDPELQRKFHFDPGKAAEKEQEQSQANAVFLDELRKQPAPPAAKVEEGPNVLVDVAEPVLENKLYSLSQPKPPEIAEGMLGATVPAFNCSITVTFLPARQTNGPLFTFRMDTLRMSIDLSITTTLPTGCSSHLKDHEDGHRIIDEHFYSFGRKSAERAGQAAFRRLFGVTAADAESAEARARATAISSLQTEYWKYTRIPANAANAFYDELTDHGRNSTNSTVAIQQALERLDALMPTDILDPALRVRSQEN